MELFLTDELDIQVTDARATMALYRLHKTEWEQAMWKETQAFLAKQKKGSNSGGDAAPIGGKKGHGPGHDEVEGNGKKRKSAAQDGTTSKRPKKAALNGKVVQGEGSRDDGNWWES